MYQTQNLHVPPEIRTAIVLSFLDVCLHCGSPILEQCNLLPTIVLLSSDLPTTDSLKRGHGGSGLFWTRWNLSPVKFHRHMAVFSTMVIWIFQQYRLLNKPIWGPFWDYWLSLKLICYATLLPLLRCNTNTQVMFSRVKKSKPTLAVYSVSRENEGGRVTNTHFSLWQIHTSLGDKYPLRLALTNAPNTFWLTG